MRRHRAREHIDENATLLKGFEHSEMSHAASGATSEGQPDPNASQMMNDAFESMLSKCPGLVQRIKSELEVSFGEFGNSAHTEQMGPWRREATRSGSLPAI